MTGTEALISILGLAIIATGGYVWKAYINAAAQRHDSDHRVRVTEEETRRYDIVARIAAGNERVAAHLADKMDAQGELLKRLDERDQLIIGDEPVVSGEIGKRITRKVPAAHVHNRLDGDFIILSVESGQIHNGFQVRVKNVDSGEELRVSIPEGTLPPGQISDLQSGEWGKTPLHMQMNIVRADSRIVGATLVSAGPPQHTD